MNKIATTTVAAIGVLGFSSAAFAGEGGVAGAAPVVTGVAVAAAVGKQDAAAAYNVPDSTLAQTDVGVQNYAYSYRFCGSDFSCCYGFSDRCRDVGNCRS